MVTCLYIVLYSTNWQAVTQCILLCLNSEMLRPNISYTKWRSLLNHLSSLVLRHSAASVGTRSQRLEPVNWLEHCKRTIAFRNYSESSNSIYFLKCTLLVIFPGMCWMRKACRWHSKHTLGTMCNEGGLFCSWRFMFSYIWVLLTYNKLLYLISFF